MKYANLVLDPAKNMINIGDGVQILAVENLYRHMGINYKDVVRIKVGELSSYDGEEVVLPINYPMFGFYDLSPKILPVYLGISVMTGLCMEGLRGKGSQPIGCRDIHTYKEMITYDLKAYCSGCITLTLPKRELSKSNSKVFLVDAPGQVVEIMPSELKKDAVYRSHIYYDKNCPDEDVIRALYNEYYSEAKLVVTSRIHCAMPCLAAGIPVVFACERPSFRYNVLDGLTTVYTPENFNQIDWTVKPVEFEDRKRYMLEYAELRVRAVIESTFIDDSTHKSYQNILNEYYYRDSEPYKNVTVTTFKRYLEQRYDKDSEFRFVLWGVTQIADLTYRMIEETFPKAIFSGVIDMYRHTEFYGKESASFEELNDLEYSIVLVTAGSANPVAEHYFKKYHIGRHCLCYNGFHIEDGVRIGTNGTIDG